MRTPKTLALIGVLLWIGVGACRSSERPGDVPRHGWWSGNGAVVPHESFPGDCGLCHTGKNWLDLDPQFEFDHGTLTGVELHGAHTAARCLRCHNDRGPVETFQVQGCAGCHEDLHQGRLGQDCASCHTEQDWFPVGQLERHSRTRFPLAGAHATTACRRCHVGSEIGVFEPLDSECLSCHRPELARALNPNHAALGFVDNCDRCHRPTSWNDAQNN
jgi:hypothetical protein